MDYIRKKYIYWYDNKSEVNIHNKHDPWVYDT